MVTKKLKSMFAFGRRIAVFVLAIVLVFSFVACSGKVDNGGNKGGGNIDLTPPAETLPDGRPEEGGVVGPDVLPEDAFTYDYAATTEVGYYGEITNSNVTRKKPQVNSGKGPNAVVGTDYPIYGTNYGGSDKDDIITESSYLTATGTANAGGGGYTWMDENGFLYSGTRAEPVETGRQLYMHTAAAGNYHGDVDDDEPGVEKTVTIRPRGYSSYSVTGIYAPAGEVIKIQISEEDMERTGGLTIHIGQALYNGQANNIWSGKAMPRMPHLLNTMQVTKNTAVLENGVYTGYVGSFLGGPLYIRNNNSEFTATISGGVEYPHFILGYTTKEEYNRLSANCSAPYFDLEVWNYGVLISGAKRNAQRFSYDDLYKAAILWEKITQVTTTGSNQGIVMLFEPFVAAGAAVAFPGRSSVNCPEGWMANSLDYNLMVTSGAWGNFHEYHHNFQGFGVGGGGEVTNNAMTLVSYALFTKISSARTITNFGGDGLGGGWNRYTSATWALEETLKIARPNENPGNGNQGLALYATLLHNFGPNEFIQAKVAGGGQSYAAYMNAWQNVTHNNMYYYFSNILGGTGITNNADSSYPMFVPVSCVYQTGRSFTYDGEKKYITTMQPYMIKAGEPFTIDFSPYTVSSGQYQSGSIVIPSGFTYRVKSISKPTNGTVAIINSNTATYTPDAAANKSGKIIVTLEITKNDNSFKVEDVDLVLEFEPSRELNKSTLERTIYTYESENMYADAVDAFDGGFEGYESVLEKIDHSNPPQSQIVNTDIWYWNNTDAEHNAHPNAPDFYFKPLQDTINVIDGKLYFENDGKYRVYLRGRYNCALYYSLDGKDYALGANIADSNDSLYFRPANAATYFDIEFKHGDVTVNVNAGGGNTASYDITTSSGSIENWLYIKEVLIVIGEQTGKVPYIGVGMKQWDETLFTINERFCDANGNTVSGTDSDGYAYTETTCSNSNGTVIASKRTHKSGTVDYYSHVTGDRVRCTETEYNVLTQAELSEPTVTNNSQPYANAYRCSYEFPDNGDYQSDYFYKRSYTYNYQDNVQLGVGKQRVVEEQCANLNLNTGWGTSNLSVVVDGVRDQGDGMQLHTNGKPTAEKPFTMVIDLGEVVTANRLMLYSQNRSDSKFPTALKLYASLDGENYTLIDSYTDLPHSGITQTIDFADTQMRYYKIEVIDTVTGHLIIRELEMWHIMEINGGTKITPDGNGLVFTGDWQYAQAPSSFGHVYVGKTGSKLSFDFTGTRLGILMSPKFGKNFEVYIDGNKVESIGLKADAGSLVFLSDAMQNAKHRVELRCTGEASIDSIIIYQ